MQTEIDSLRQRITEIEAEKAELKAELEAKNSEIPELKKKLAEVEARNVEIEARNAKLMKQMIEENNRRDARIGDTNDRIEDTNDRVAKLEQKQLQDDNTPNNNLSNFNSGAEHHEEPLEDKGMDDFLNEVDKKRIGDDIRRHNKEKKLLRESEKIVTKDRLSNANEPLQVQKDIANSASEELEKSETQSDTKIIPHEVETNLTEEPAILEPLQFDSAKDKTESIAPKSLASSSIVTEFVQDLLEELLLSDIQPLESINFSPPKTIVPGSIDIKRLANLFSQAVSARKKSITAKRAEISSWGCFSERFENKVVELRSKDKKLADKTARTQIYDEMKPYLTDTSDEYLRVRTCKARKINKLFGFEYNPITLKKVNGIGWHMVQRVTYSADRISKLTNPQIDYIIEQVKSKTITDQSSVDEIFETVAITPSHDPNSSSVISPAKPSEVVDDDLEDYIKTLTEGDDGETAKWGTPYENSARIGKEEANEVNSDDGNDSSNSEEEMLDDSDDDGYNGNGGYNEYGERDRGYYYRDGRYERRGSPMMSPIISPVTA